MDLLAALLGSKVRADVLALLFGGGARRLGMGEIERSTKHPRQVVDRQVRRLLDVGLVRSHAGYGRTTYEPDVHAPGGREIAALVRQTRGKIPKVRHALVMLRMPALAWALPARDSAQRRYEVVVLTSAPRSLVRVQLSDLVARECPLHVMSVREWVTRLEKGDVDLRRLRRTRKLWVLGSWEQLVAAERDVLEAKRLLEKVTANWQEELSDDWDDNWDPFQPLTGAAR